LPRLERRNHRVAFFAETHLHADFVSGSRELADQGAQVLAASAGGIEFPHRGLGDGDEVDLGGRPWGARHSGAARVRCSDSP
jgi:hydroxyacylglutathione hydrolase